ncbi:MAG: DUF1839 family protein [Gemmatimonadaceae bacterium]
MMSPALSLDTGTYAPHELHGLQRVWPETNCYVDLWIELLHSLQMDPRAMLAFTVAMDFEGDQWTFFKPSLSDIYALYGIDVQELAIWRPLPLHIAEQVSLGRTVLVEVDAFFLPDTQGVSYGIHHTKTTVAINAIDLISRRLGYFHNAGLFELSGTDFDGLFAGCSDAATHGVTLAPYTEIAKLDRLVRRTETELRNMASELLSQHLQRSPRTNPVARYRKRFLKDVAWLSEQDMAVFHQYAFATLRQCGACAELASSFLGWMDAQPGEKSAAAEHFGIIAASAKALQFKLARAVSTKKPTDFETALNTMEDSWGGAMSDLTARYSG